MALWSRDLRSSRQTEFDKRGNGFYDALLDLDLDVSADGTQIFVTSQHERTVTVLDSARGEIVTTHAAKGYPPVLSGNGQRLYAGSTVSDAESGASIGKLPFRDGDLFSRPVFNSTGERIAMYPGDGARVWNVAREGVERIAGPLPRPKKQLGPYAISPSGRYVATVGITRVRIYESDGGSAVESYAVSEQVKEVEFSRNDAFVLTVGNRTARVTDLSTGRPVASFGGHQDDLLKASFGPGARTVATLGYDGLVIVHDCPACAPPATLVKRARAALRVHP